MTDEELKRILRKLTIPMPDESAIERARLYSQIALSNNSFPLQKFALPWGWVASAATVCLMFVVFAFWRRLPENHSDEIQLLSEMNALFPGQIDAVVKRGADVSVELSAESLSGAAQPLAITLERRGSIIRVLGYSGRKLCITLDGRDCCFEPLINDMEEVILAGDDFLWRPENPASIAGWHVSTRPLAAR